MLIYILLLEKLFSHYLNSIKFKRDTYRKNVLTIINIMSIRRKPVSGEYQNSFAQKFDFSQRHKRR